MFVSPIPNAGIPALDTGVKFTTDGEPEVIRRDDEYLC